MANLFSQEISLVTPGGTLKRSLFQSGLDTVEAVTGGSSYRAYLPKSSLNKGSILQKMSA